jgi:hypothetical protein
MQFEARLFDQWAGSGEFTPTAILFPLLGKVRVFRLWQPSQNPKHGKNKVSKEAEQSLFAAVEQFGRYPRVLRFSSLLSMKPEILVQIRRDAVESFTCFLSPPRMILRKKTTIATVQPYRVSGSSGWKN